MEDPVLWIIQNADHLGTVVLLLMAGVGLYKKWIVLGWTYDEVAKQRDTYQTIIDAYNNRLEEKVERYEQERYGSAKPS